MIRIASFFILATVVVPSLLLAQSASIQGRITGSDDFPLEGAHVTVLSSAMGSSTDSDGNFLLRALPTGVLTLRVSHLGYAAVTRTVTLTAGEHLRMDLCMSERSVDLGEVTVTGTRNTDLLRNIPHPVSVVGAEKLLRSTPVSVPDALDAEAGVDLVRDGVWGTDISIRGMQRSNVVTLIDGVRIETATAHAAGMSLVDITDIERIEVLRGAFSSMYGTGATGGVVNIITRSGDYAQELRMGGSMNSSYSSMNNGSAGALTLDASDRNWFFHAHGGLRSAEDARTPDGTLRDSRYHDNSVAFSGGIRLGGAHELRLRWQRMRAVDVGIPGGDSFPAMASARYPDEERTLLLGEYRSGPLGTALRDISLRYAHQLIGRNVEIIPSSAVTLRPSADHDMHSAQLTSSWIFDGQQLSVGFDAWQRSYDGIRLREIHSSNTVIADLPLPAARFRSLGMYAQDDFALMNDRLRVSLGGRADAIHVENDEGYDLQYIIANGVRTDAPASRTLRWKEETGDDVSWSAQAGLLYHLTDRFSLTLNVSRAFRSPSLEERYQFIELGGATYVGDPDLAAEKATMIDVGARFHDVALSLTANAFLRSMGDLVIDAQVSDTLYRKVNVGEARIYGMEFTGEINPWSSLVAYMSLAFVRGEDTGNGTDLPQMPPLSGRAGLRFPLTGYAFVDAFATFAADQDAVAVREAHTPGYALFHLQARSTQIRVGGVGMQLIAAVDNIFDRSWRRHLSTLRGFIISEPGRNMSLRLRLLW